MADKPTYEELEKRVVTLEKAESERKIVGAALRESEARLRRAELASKSGNWEFHLDSNIIYGSDGAIKLYGVNKDKFEYADIKRIPLREYRQLLDTALKKLIEHNKPYDVEFKIKTVDTGEIKDIHSTAIFDIEKRTLFGIIQDITERKQVEEALKESEEKYRLLVENANELILVAQDGLARFVNRKALDFIGYAPEELIGKQFTDYIHPEDRKTVADRHLKRLKGEDVSGTYPFRILDRAGASKWVEINSVRIKWKGEPATLNFLADITERKQAEEEKRRLEERLQRAEKMEALGTLAGGVAHDLNNVLGVVVGYAELLLDDVDASSPSRRGLENIMAGGKKAAAIVEDLLTLARRGVPGRSVLNLNKVILADLCSPEFENLSFHHSGVRIRTSLEPDLLNISGSAVQLGKTLFNLVCNGAEAMPKGGTLTIKTANAYLDKPIHGYDEIREGDYVVLSVSDTGEGIHTADLKRIFEPFYTKKMMGKSGTGLGLAVVWGTVKDHNGYINVQSEERRGSTFTLYFPVTREELTAEAVSIPLCEYLGKGETLLVVDDIKEQRDLAATMLRKLHYHVESVSSGEEALAYLKAHPVDLIVLDMIMDSGMDGLDTYRGALEIRPKQKAILVSGFSESERVVAAQALGAGAYVKKPYVMVKLGLAVKKELERAL
jgi:PAS domain S-box-containing protein